MSGCYQFQKDVCTNWFLFFFYNETSLISESVLVSVNTGFLTRSLLSSNHNFWGVKRGVRKLWELWRWIHEDRRGDLFQEKALPSGGSYDLNCEWKEYVPWWMESRRLFKCRGHCGGRLLKMTRRRQAAWRRCCLPNKEGERWVTWNGLGSQKQRLWLQGTQQAHNTALALPSLPVHRVDELTVCDWEGSLERMRVRQQEISENFSLHFIILRYFAFWIFLRIKIHALSIYFCKTTWHILYCLNFKINHSRRWDGLLEDMI